MNPFNEECDFHCKDRFINKLTASRETLISVMSINKLLLFCLLDQYPPQIYPQITSQSFLDKVKITTSVPAQLL